MFLHGAYRMKYISLALRVFGVLATDVCDLDLLINLNVLSSAN
jgi:hypothetical protein